MSSADNDSRADFDQRCTSKSLQHRRVVVGLSGGVDSAVAAASLVAQGYDVHAVTLDTWKAGKAENKSLSLARAVAIQLRISISQRDLRHQFHERIVKPFAGAYARGQTPNPCIFCNPDLKFATLLEVANAIGAAWIATGHYTRVVHADGKPSRLLRACAESKDQSYALYRLTQPCLRRLLLPLGGVESKAEVRRMARQWQLPTAEANDSQDLCFVSTEGYAELVASLYPRALDPGPIYDETGMQVGEHHGLARYTVGQRRGVGIASPRRLYVIQLDSVNNALRVGPRALLKRQSCYLRDVTFISGEPPDDTFEALGRIRYRAPLTPVQVTVNESGGATVRFVSPQTAVAPGQSLVLYHGEEMLGGGVISLEPNNTHDRP